MTNLNSLTGLPPEIGENTAKKWGSLLAKITWVVVIIGAVGGLVIWFLAGGSTPKEIEFGKDIAALTWCVSFGAALALMSIRQILLVEVEGE